MPEKLKLYDLMGTNKFLMESSNEAFMFELQTQNNSRPDQRVSLEIKYVETKELWQIN